MKVLDNEPENEITITVFRMLVLDLLELFHVVNQAMINILGRPLNEVPLTLLTKLFQVTSLKCLDQMRKDH
jgi:hypothetical protein